MLPQTALTVDSSALPVTTSRTEDALAARMCDKGCTTTSVPSGLSSGNSPDMSIDTSMWRLSALSTSGRTHRING